MTSTIQLQRVTTQFDEVEDRIRLVGEIRAGHTLVIWITHRLLNRLVHQLLGWLKIQCGADPRGEMLQGFAQQLAIASLKPQPSVVHASGASWLVQEVGLNTTQSTVRLVFRGAEANDQAVLVLEAQSARKWLKILCDQYLLAQWSMTVWPDWMRETQPIAAEGASATWH